MTDLKYDRRQSGRTTKCLLAACKYASANRATVVYVLPTGNLLPYVGPILRKIDPSGKWNPQERSYKLSDGGQVLLVTMKNPAVKIKELFVQGYPEDAAFFDHEAIRLGHNRTIAEFHRYD